MIYFNNEYDTTLIELKEEDNIKEYLELFKPLRIRKTFEPHRHLR